MTKQAANLLPFFGLALAAAIFTGCETIAGAGRRRTVSDNEVRYKYERDQMNQNIQEVKYSVESAEQSAQRTDAKVNSLENNMRHYQSVTGNEIAQLRAEVNALRDENESLRADMAKIRSEVVADITDKVTALINEQQKRYQAAAAAAAAAAPAASSANRGSGYEHKVCPGETLSAISVFYKVPVEKIRAANPRKIKPGDVIRAGDILFIPD